MSGGLQEIGAVLAAHVDMIKGFMGDQFAVSIIARHKVGPCHLLMGDDAELSLMQCLSELLRAGKTVAEGGHEVDQPEASPTTNMVDLLREASEAVNSGQHWSAADQLDWCARVDDVLEIVDPPKAAGKAIMAITDGKTTIYAHDKDVPEDQLTVAFGDPFGRDELSTVTDTDAGGEGRDGRKVTVTTTESVSGMGNAVDCNLGPLLPEGETGPFTLAAPEGERKRICSRCLQVLKPEETDCPVCGGPVIEGAKQ